MKICTKCKLEKDESEFFVHSKKTGKLRPACKVCTAATTKAWTEANKEKHMALNRAWHKENVERAKEAARKWVEENREKIRATKRLYYKISYRNNPFKFFAKNAKRRSKIKEQVLNLSQEEKQKIEYMYWLTRDLRAVTGETYHVDHIQPLAKGGLHHPNNLQVLPADINLKKGAK